MKKIMLFLVAIIHAYVCGMEQEKPEFITLLNPQGEKIGVLLTDLLPLGDLSQLGFGDILTVHLDPSFVPFLRNILYAQKTMACIENPSKTCNTIIQKIIETESPKQSTFTPWFELIALLDMFNTPKAILYPLIVHLTKRIKNYEQECINEFAAKIEENRQLLFLLTWIRITQFYEILFKEKLKLKKIEGIEEQLQKMEKEGFSIGELFALNLLNEHIFVHYLDDSDPTQSVDSWALHLNGYYINSLNGIESLEHFVPEEFSFFHDIISIYLQNNQLTAANFTPFQNLKIIDLSDNEIADLNKIILPTTLETLYLNNNKITIIPENFAANCEDLDELDLSNNQITLLPNNIFENNPSLGSLSLAHNKITQLPASFLYQHTLIDAINISNNNLTQLPDNFLASSEREMAAVYLHNNNLISLPPHFLENNHEDLEAFTTINKDGSIPDLLPEWAKPFIEKEKEVQKKRKAEEEAEDQPEAKRRKIEEPKEEEK